MYIVLVVGAINAMRWAMYVVNYVAKQRAGRLGLSGMRILDGQPIR